MIDTLKVLITNLIGSYQPNTYQIDGNTDVIAQGMAGVDWVWIGSLFMFALTFYCVMRLVGVIINAIRN